MLHHFYRTVQETGMSNSRERREYSEQLQVLQELAVDALKTRRLDSNQFRNLLYY